MVRVIYDISDEKLEEEVIEPNFIFANKLGGYFLDYKTTKYRGMFASEKVNNNLTLIKSLDTISISQVPSEIIYNLWSVKKIYGKTKETFFYHNDSLLYEVKEYNGTSLLTLDVRDIHDFDITGKKYKITARSGFLIIEFSKGDFMRYIAIKSSAAHIVVNKWAEREFSFDKHRKSGPENWYVYDALKFNIEGEAKIAIAYSSDKEKAVNDANYMYYSHKHIETQKQSRINTLFSKRKMSKSLRVAYKCSLKNLDDLLIENNGFRGIYAGLPWFYQIWSRDESISLGAFIAEKKYDLAKELLMGLISNILPDGRIGNRMPESSLGSADGVGWAFKRLADLFNVLVYDNKQKNGMTSQEMTDISRKLKESIDKHLKYYVHDGLLFNNKKETWMDTDIGNDPRDGARIEIQALMLSMLNFAKNICKHIDDPDWKSYSRIENDMRRKVKYAFYNNGVLYDGFSDPTIRPNIFLAYYIYPKLLSNSEWKLVFKNTLRSIWLDWGGVSTIDKLHPLFCNEYSGQDDKSYHRGDSWYFLNNIVVICLYRLDKTMFSRYITQIVEASTEEVLRLGALGCHSEVSSAKQKRSEGAISQAWSMATYIEMINELF